MGTTRSGDLMAWDTRDIVGYFKAQAEGIELAAVSAMRSTVEGAVENMHNTIRTKTTETGDERASGASSSSRDRGYGEAGRIETRDMYDAVSGEVSADGDITKEQVTVILGRFGWLDGGPDYTEFQEDGTSAIEPMHALLTASLWANEDLDGKIIGVAGER